MDFFNINYDKDNDTLYIDLADDKMSNIREVESGVFIKRDIKTNMVTSIIIKNVKKIHNNKTKNKEVGLSDIFGKKMKIYSFDELLNQKDYFNIDGFLSEMKRKNRIEDENDTK